ncbi:MAG TPA: SGNH/GDSL hydrolase family protein [Candidatus Obscuribacterales bacterium]
MKKRILVTLTLLSLIMVLLLGTMQNYLEFNELYVFGDSLSDAGNVFRATRGMYPPNPPYFQGRYSNGPVWVENLASKLALTPKQVSNFACGGATTGSESSIGVPGLSVQVQSFTKAHRQVNPNALYVIWAGANDYLHGTGNITRTIANLSEAIASLATSGAKTILVGNLPDLGKIPATRNNVSSSSLSSLTREHNFNLANSLDILKQKFGSDTQILTLDAYSLYQEAITTPAKFGFTNVTGSCLDNYAVCKSPDQFLFWDSIHPTAATHRILAESAFLTLKTGDSLRYRPEVLK